MQLVLWWGVTFVCAYNIVINAGAMLLKEETCKNSCFVFRQARCFQQKVTFRLCPSRMTPCTWKCCQRPISG